MIVSSVVRASLILDALRILQWRDMFPEPAQAIVARLARVTRQDHRQDAAGSAEEERLSRRRSRRPSERRSKSSPKPAPIAGAVKPIANYTMRAA